MLGESIRVRISTEAAGAIALTPVVNQPMTPVELVEHIVSVTGKDAARVRDILARGSLVVRGSRLRWDSWQADEPLVTALLARVPGPDPALPFSAARCVTVVLVAGGTRLELQREVLERRRLFRRRSFWDVVNALAAPTPPGYIDYSYAERADRYRMPMDDQSRQTIQAASYLLTVSDLAGRVRGLRIDAIEFLVARGDPRP